MNELFAAVVALIFVHGVGGHDIEINVAEISTIRQPGALPEGHVPNGTNCIIIMTNAKYIYTKEDCKEVIKKIAELEEGQKK